MIAFVVLSAADIHLALIQKCPFSSLSMYFNRFINRFASLQDLP